jgi:hypothetical protein
VIAEANETVPIEENSRELFEHVIPLSIGSVQAMFGIEPIFGAQLLGGNVWFYFVAFH